MQIGSPQVLNYIIGADGGLYRLSVVPIGVWNMVGTGMVQVAHGLVGANIRQVFARIINDAGDAFCQLQKASDTMITNIDGAIMEWTATHVTCVRRAGGHFSTASFNDGVMNRGDLFIWYVD